MTSKKPTLTKTTFQANIKKTQAQWNRFHRRYKASKNVTERKFLKSEATRLYSQLRQYSKQWQNYGFGAYTWITKNFSTTNFVAATRTTRTTGARKSTTVSRRTSARKSPTQRTYGRRTTTRTSSRRGTTTRSRNTSRTRSSAARRGYTSW